MFSRTTKVFLFPIAKSKDLNNELDYFQLAEYINFPTHSNLN